MDAPAPAPVDQRRHEDMKQGQPSSASRRTEMAAETMWPGLQFALQAVDYWVDVG
jgi:hypothetical protein